MERRISTQPKFAGVALRFFNIVWKINYTVDDIYYGGGDYRPISKK